MLITPASSSTHCLRVPAQDSIAGPPLLDLLRIGDWQARGFALGTASHGETQWLELGILITQNPAVILLDEPTAGMTEGETMRTAAIINEMRRDHTIVAVEHDMAFVKEIASRITVMHLGKIIAEGSVADIEANAAVREAYLGSKGIV